MGSHGGATAEGQIEVLKNLGITEESVGAPILSSMEVQEIGRTKLGFPVLVDKHLCQADRIIVVNRIKPHTDFKGDIESGLIKMMVIGMGKHAGALTAHQLTIKHGFPSVLSKVSSVILEKLPIWFGLGSLRINTMKQLSLNYYDPRTGGEGKAAFEKGTKTNARTSF